MMTEGWLVVSVLVMLVLFAFGMRAAYHAGRMHERVVWLESWPDLPAVPDVED